MPRPKTIKLYLMDGTADGRIKCTIDPWIGEAYKIPRELVPVCKDRKQLQWTGVYFLFGTSEKTGNPCVYVGQAGVRKNKTGITQRLLEHDREKESYWTDAVAFIASNNTFGQTDISFLENYFYNKAAAAGRYEMVNAADPTQGNITEEKEAELLSYADSAEMILTTLGYKVFLPEKKENQKPLQNVIDVYLQKASGVNAAGKFNAYTNALTIMKGSVVSDFISEKYAASNVRPYRLRIAYEADGTIKNHKFTKDAELTSPSYAAAVILGRSADGKLEWKTKEGIRIADLDIQ